MVSACSGHGFKHSAALGEFLAQELGAEAKTVQLKID
jgi:glycine/D-amino acid oxidase-like deaminating enzyme